MGLENHFPKMYESDYIYKNDRSVIQGLALFNIEIGFNKLFGFSKDQVDPINRDHLKVCIGFGSLNSFSNCKMSF